MGKGNQNIGMWSTYVWWVEKTHGLLSSKISGLLLPFLLSTNSTHGQSKASCDSCRKRNDPRVFPGKKIGATVRSLGVTSIFRRSFDQKESEWSSDVVMGYFLPGPAQ